jgi:hypothetical protein
MAPDPLAPFRPLLAEAAASIDWPADLLAAQVLVESSGDPYALRVEFDLWRRTERTIAAARWGPLYCTSFGLGQILFMTALDEGFTGRPEDLFVPRTNLTVMIRHLDTLRRQILGLRGSRSVTAPDVLGTSTEDPSRLLQSCLAAYNAGLGSLRGSDQKPFRAARYVEKVVAQYRTLQVAGEQAP